MKKLDKWAPHELTERTIAYRSAVLFSHGTKGILFLHRRVMCDENDTIVGRRQSAQWLDADEASIHMPKQTLYPRKITVTDGLRIVLSIIIFSKRGQNY